MASHLKHGFGVNSSTDEDCRSDSIEYTQTQYKPRYQKSKFIKTMMVPHRRAASKDPPQLATHTKGYASKSPT